MTDPTISAVVCTRNRPDMIGRAVASLLANKGIDFEVVVIDQSDGDETKEIVEEFGGARYVRSDARGLSRARNLGAREAKAGYIAFTDDDCEVPTDWLSRAAGLMDACPEASVLYGTVWAAPEMTSDAGAVPCLTLSERRLVGGAFGYHLGGMGANMVIRRSGFDRLGGFDEALGAGGPLSSAEDFDLQFRAHRLECATLLEPSLSVTHYGFRTWEEWRGLFWRDGIGVGAFFMKHVRCHDRLAAKDMLRFTALEAARSVKSLIVRRDSRRLVLVAGIFAGAFRSLRFPVDHKSRLYQNP